MSFSKQKTVTVTTSDFIEQNALYYTEFTGKDGSSCLVQVLPDLDVESPREWDNLWTWVTTPGAGYSDIKPGYYKESRNSHCQKYYYRPEDFEDDSGRISKEFAKTHLIVPLFLYRHSGDVISVGNYGATLTDKLFDAGCMGFAFLSHEKIKEEYQCKCITKEIKKRALEYLEEEVKAMNAVNFGEVYGFKIINLETEEEDSSWGYICTDILDMKYGLYDMLLGWIDEDNLQEVFGDLFESIKT